MEASIYLHHLIIESKSCMELRTALLYSTKGDTPLEIEVKNRVRFSLWVKKGIFRMLRVNSLPLISLMDLNLISSVN